MLGRWGKMTDSPVLTEDNGREEVVEVLSHANHRVSIGSAHVEDRAQARKTLEGLRSFEEVGVDDAKVVHATEKDDIIARHQGASNALQETEGRTVES